MTAEEKQLLLIDLSARLPYRVKVRVTIPWANDVEFASDIKIRRLNASILDVVLDNDDPAVKPYLRPMSSMTEEERREYEKTFEMFDLLYLKTWRTYDWLNENHFDYRDLIPMGLALPAEEGMYDTKK